MIEENVSFVLASATHTTRTKITFHAGANSDLNGQLKKIFANVGMVKS